MKKLYRSHRGLRVLFWVVVLVIVYLLGPRWEGELSDRWFARADGRPLIMAHGGAKELFPENTMIAFEGAAAMGVDVLEMDVIMTADGVLVTIHGPDLEVSTDGKGPVREATFAEIQELDAAYRFQDLNGDNPWKGTGVRHPALRTVLARFQDTDLLFVIELKDDGEHGQEAAVSLANMIRAMSLEERVMVASFSPQTLQAFREAADGNVPTSGSEPELRRIVIPTIFGLDKWWVFPGQVAALQMPVEGAGFDLTEKKIIDRAHQHGLAVHYWTIDDPEMMKTLAERGADGMITDRPDLARKIFQELGFDLPDGVDPSSLNPPQ